MIKVEIHTADSFKVLDNLPEGTNFVICIGGRGGMKTYEISKFIARKATLEKKRCAVLRDEKELIRESILNEILLRFDSANEYGLLSMNFDRLDTGIKDKETGEMLVFTKGFRASDNSKKANLKSISNVDIAVVEEAEDIRDEDKFNTFSDSIRKKGSLIILVLNTPDIGHWIIKRYFNTLEVKDEAGESIDGYFKIEPKKIPGFICISTSYEDNPYLPQHIKDKYKSYGDPNSPFYNLHYYYTAIKGYASTGRKGQILKKVKPISLKEYLALPFKEVYGQDFGTASPAGMVGVKFDKNNCYARQLNYLPKNTLEIGKFYCSLNLGPSDKIIADSADKDACDKLKNGWKANELSVDDLAKYPRLINGFHVVKCKKGADSIRNGINIMDGLNLFAVEESKDLWNEIMNYVYAQDKNGNYTNDPIDDFNHLIDPWRYVVEDNYRQRLTIFTG